MKIIRTLVIVVIGILTILLFRRHLLREQDTNLPHEYDARPVVEQPATSTPRRRQPSWEEPVTEMSSPPLSQPDDEALPPMPPTEYFDNGRPDLLSGRTTAFEDWKERNADLWAEMDRTVQDCVYIKYVNAFGSSPEKGLDECLDYFENEGG